MPEPTPISFLKVGFTDLDGVVRAKYIPNSKIQQSIKIGIGFCNVVFGWDMHDECYSKDSVSGWGTGFPDGVLKLDPTTLRKLPWEKEIELYLGDFSEDPLLNAVCPRSLLKKILAQADEAGFQAKFGAEFEWFMFQKNSEDTSANNHQNLTPLSSGMFGYSMLRTSEFQEFTHRIISDLTAAKLRLEGLHTETGPGVYEAAISYSDALEMADQSSLFKLGIKQIANEFDLMASFMAKWSPLYPGCGGHLHQCLWDEKGENMFYSSDNEFGLSTVAQQYLAGQLYCLPFILPMFAPTVNSYRRYLADSWAPTTLSWGVDNRTTAIRVVPEISGGRHLEHRVSGADINPYLAISACLASGLYGIKNKLPLTVEHCNGNAYKQAKLSKLPESLTEAVHQMKHSDLASELFGESFVDHFILSREWELEQSLGEDWDWELQRYFEII
ncbi:MAG: glutamine synthetase [Balneola sp.]|nr:glutamine synthetase [Balneola sp.]